MESTTDNNTIREFKLELDSTYKESEILEMGLEPLKIPEMGYILYEYNSMVYFFEQIEDDLYRHYCSTSKQSYYLS